MYRLRFDGYEGVAFCDDGRSNALAFAVPLS